MIIEDRRIVFSKKPGFKIDFKGVAFVLFLAI
jgi:hypothetical protein